MQPGDVYLLSPEISMVGLAALVVLADLVLRRKGPLAVLAIVGLVVPLAFTIALWSDVTGDPAGQKLLQLGNTVTLSVDQFALFFKVLVLGVVALVLLASTDYIPKFPSLRSEYYGLILLSAVGMMLLAATRELISIYLSLELATLPLVVLAAFLRDDKSTEAAMKFFVLAAVSSALLLYGMVLVYGYTGSTQLSVIAQNIRVGEAGLPFGSYPMLLGIVLMAAGFGFKIAAVPFQMWIPDVYEGSPTPITAYLSVGSKAAGFAVILRVFYEAFGSVSLDWSMLFGVIAVASMTVGNLVAMAQSNIKRLLAYSTIAHAGYILVGLAAVSARGPAEAAGLGSSGVLFYLVAYATTNLAAFFAVIAIANKTGSERIDDFTGMGQRAPVLAAVLAVSLISLTGIPPTAGFIGKLYLFNAAVQANLVWLAIAGVINSVVSAYYYLRVVRVMYLGKPASSERVPFSAAGHLALLVSGAGILVVGIIPRFLLEVAQRAVGAILGGA